MFRSSPVVDQALEVVDEYHTRINQLENKILLKPNVKTVRDRKCLISYVCIDCVDVESSRSAHPVW